MKRNGFTLIEMLVVLSLLSVLLLFSVPLQFQTLTTQSEKAFIEQFKMDVLFLQSQSGLIRRDRYYIRFLDDEYQVLQGRNSVFNGRPYPKEWKLRYDTRPDLSYAASGTVIRPRTIEFLSKTERIRFIFPLGKGGFYVDKEKRVLND
jgi:competence protein ComGD